MRDLARIYDQRLRRFISRSHREDEPTTEWNPKGKGALREGEASDWVFPAPMLASVSRGEFVRLFRGAVSTLMRASAVAPGLEDLLDKNVGRVGDEELAQRRGVFATTRRWFGLRGRAGPVEEVEEEQEVEVEEVDDPYDVTGEPGPS